MKKKLLFTTIAMIVFAFSMVSAQTNLNFESWTGNEPNGWATFNQIPVAPQTTFKETANPGQGSSSAKMVTAACALCSSFYLSDPLGGMVTLGTDGMGVPFTQKPISVDFMYASNPAGGDMGGFMVQLTKWNTINQEADVIGEGWFTSSIDVLTWTNVNLPISYNSSDIPDTLIIAAFSSIGHSMFPLPGIPTPVIGSEFYIDAININLPSCAGFSVSVTGTNESAPLASDGTATANPSGGSTSYTYSWNTLETTQTINGLAPGIYSVTVTDANACVKVANYNVLMGGCNGLSVSVTGTNATSFTSNDGTATASVTGGTPPYNYTWNTGATTASISGLDVGAYAVAVIDNTGNCIQWGYYTVLSGASGINDLLIDQSIVVYPNPGTGIFAVKSENKISKIEILNLLGEKIYSVQNFKQQTSNEIDLSEFAKGIYFVKIYDKEKVHTEKIVIQ